MGLFNNSNHILAERALDAVWYKQRVISNNIANVETPDYKAKNVEFKLVLDERRKCKYRPAGFGERSGRRGEPEAGPGGFKVVTTYRSDTNQILDGNNVDMEKESLDLADAQYQYAAMIDRLNNDYRLIRSALAK
jgi:flagellar basal-body rod protein FlgB